MKKGDMSMWLEKMSEAGVGSGYKIGLGLVARARSLDLIQCVIRSKGF